MHILIDRYISDTYEGERHIDRQDIYIHIYKQKIDRQMDRQIGSWLEEGVFN